MFASTGAFIIIAFDYLCMSNYLGFTPCKRLVCCSEQRLSKNHVTQCLPRWIKPAVLRVGHPQGSLEALQQVPTHWEPGTVRGLSVTRMWVRMGLRGQSAPCSARCYKQRLHGWSRGSCLPCPAAEAGIHMLPVRWSIDGAGAAAGVLGLVKMCCLRFVDDTAEGPVQKGLGLMLLPEA